MLDGLQCDGDVPGDGLTDYESSILVDVLKYCESSGQPYIHDYELKRLGRFGSYPVYVKDALWNLHLKGYVEQNKFETNNVPTHWWRLTPKGMEALLVPNVKQSARPAWISKLSDEPLRSALDEVYRARESGFLMLPLIGARTAFDRAMFLKVGDPQRGFMGKMAAMQEAGLLTQRDVTNLQPMIEAGNAAAHRGWVPTTEILDLVISEVEHQLHDWFFRDDAASFVRTETPKRGR